MTSAERLKEELDLFSDEHKMITVSRADLERLLKQYDELKEKLNNCQR